MSDRKKKVRKAAAKVQRQLLGDDHDKEKVMEKSSTAGDTDPSYPAAKSPMIPGLIPMR
jgi:hypothetical protein